MGAPLRLRLRALPQVRRRNVDNRSRARARSPLTVTPDLIRGPASSLLLAPDRLSFGGSIVFIRITASLALVCASTLPVGAPVFAAAAAAPATSGGSCAALKADYAHVEKMMASRSADGFTDDSAPRATMRAAQDTADLTRAQLIVTLMQANHCALPDHAASELTYMLPAMTCKTDEMKGTASPPSCKMQDWQPIGSDASEAADQK